MSKITVTTIAGATSGSDANKVKIESGDTLEVASNATVGGTLGVTGDATFDTNTLKVDSSNNRVGIGTASPLSDLHQDIGLTEREGHHLYYGTDAKAAFTVLPNTGEIRIGAATAGTSGNYNTEIMSRNGGNLVTSIKADAYGRVTMPNQPAFSATRDAGDVAAQSVIVFDDARTNIGNHYNTSNGRFTAPVAGTYAFFCYAMSASNPTNINITLQFQKNGSDIGDSSALARANGSGISLGIHVSGQIIITLAAGDYIDVLNASGSGGTIYATGNAHNEFSGFLIG